MKVKKLRNRYGHVKGKPYLILEKKKHPFGKPISLMFDNLALSIGCDYVGKMGFTKDSIAFADDKVNNVSIWLHNKTHWGWISMSAKEAMTLMNSLGKMFATNRKGFVKNTYPQLPITPLDRKGRGGRL